MDKATWATRAIAGAWLVQLGISLPLWLSDGREFPLVPIFAGVQWPTLVEFTMVLLVMGALVYLILKPSRMAVAFLLPGIALLVLADVNRLQPWIFLYCIMLVPLLSAGWKRQYFLPGIRLVLAGTYFWSGIQKMNPFFAHEMFPWLVAFTGLQHTAESLPYLAWFVVALEAMAGIGLIFPASRKVAVVVVIGMHAFILLSLGPIGHNWNHVVWPWNIAFACLTWLVFWNRPLHFSWPAIRKPVALLPVILVWVLPVANIFGGWQHFLSGGYYSSMVPEAVVSYHPSDRLLVPPSARHWQYRNTDGEEFVFLDHWAIHHLRVPIYPEKWVHEKVGRALASPFHHPDHVWLRMNLKDRFSGVQEVVEIRLE